MLENETNASDPSHGCIHRRRRRSTSQTTSTITCSSYSFFGIGLDITLIIIIIFSLTKTDMYLAERILKVRGRPKLIFWRPYILKFHYSSCCYSFGSQDNLNDLQRTAGGDKHTIIFVVTRRRRHHLLLPFSLFPYHKVRICSYEYYVLYIWLWLCIYMMIASHDLSHVHDTNRIFFFFSVCYFLFSSFFMHSTFPSKYIINLCIVFIVNIYNSYEFLVWTRLSTSLNSTKCICYCLVMARCDWNWIQTKKPLKERINQSRRAHSSYIFIV